MTQTLADVLVVNIGELCTLSGPSDVPRRGQAARELGIVSDAGIALKGGRIAWVGRSGDAKSYEGPETITVDAGGGTVTPGLVDPHTHVVFGGSREGEFIQRLEGAGYADILAAGGGIHHTVRHTRAASHARLLAAAQSAARRMLAHGTTTFEAKSGYGLELETELKQLEVISDLSATIPQDVIATFMGAHAIPPGESPENFVSRVVDEMLPEVARRQLAKYVDVFCEQGVFSPSQTERIFLAARQWGFGLRLHADELSDLGGGGLAARLGAASADHLLMTSDESIRALAESDCVAVMLPGTPFFLDMKERAPARQMLEAGVAVGLGTDYNPGSCYSESMPLMMTLACLHLKMTPAEALVAATWNAAYSLGMTDRIGSIEPGKQADLVVWEAPNHAHLAYHFGVSLAQCVIKKGQVVF